MRFLPAAVRYVVHFSVIIIPFIAFLDGFIVRVLLGVLHFPLWLSLGLAFLGFVAPVAICKIGHVLFHLTTVPFVSICRTCLVSTVSVQPTILPQSPSAKTCHNVSHICSASNLASAKTCQLSAMSVQLAILPQSPSAKPCHMLALSVQLAILPQQKQLQKHANCQPCLFI